MVAATSVVVEKVLKRVSRRERRTDDRIRLCLEQLEGRDLPAPLATSFSSLNLLPQATASLSGAATAAQVSSDLVSLFQVLRSSALVTSYLPGRIAIANPPTGLPDAIASPNAIRVGARLALAPAAGAALASSAAAHTAEAFQESGSDSTDNSADSNDLQGDDSRSVQNDSDRAFIAFREGHSPVISQDRESTSAADLISG
jgi:hypothetical protein